MKKTFIFLVLILFSAQIASAQNPFRKVAAKNYPSINDIQFLDANNGFAVTTRDLNDKYARILITTDGGDYWEEHLHVTPDISLNTVYFLDNNTGYIGGDDYTLYKTTDGGVVWDSVDLGVTDGDVDEVWFADANNGWIMLAADVGHILHTTDGGATWNDELTAAEDLLDISFSDATHAVTVGKNAGVIYYTTDGTTWQNAALPQLGGYMYSRSDLWGVYMIDNNTVCAAGWGSRAAGLQPTIHLKSTDGGNNWEYMDQTDGNTYVNMKDMLFKDADNGLVTGGSSYEGGMIKRTTDGGVTWVETGAPFGFNVEAITNVGDEVWVAGSGGTIAHSTDFGVTWQIQTAIPSASLYGIQARNGFIFAAGFDGLFLRSEDKGETWTGSYVFGDGVCPNIQDIWFVDENVGYTARNYRFVNKTTDGGITWTTAMEDTSDLFQTLYGVHFMDANNGAVVGRVSSGTGVVYVTDDGGATWQQSTGMFGDNVNNVWMLDENNIVVVGDGLLMMYTEDGGANWTGATVNGESDADIVGVYFLDSQNGIAAGDAVLKTTDGGKTWDTVTIEGLEDEMKGAAMVDMNTWYVDGYEFIYKTTDAGATWTNIADPEIMDVRFLYSMDVDENGDAWFAGYESAIFTTSPVVTVDENDNYTPSEYALLQNYPNPFNPSTSIEFRLPEAGTVNIKLYNSIGQLMGTLFEGNKPAGSHKFTYDASSLSSGVYFYTMEAGGTRITKKMVLLK